MNTLVDSTDLSLIIDPGGIPGIRPGINLRVFPSGDSIGEFQPVGANSERLASGSLSSGGFRNYYEFQTSFLLDGKDFDEFWSILEFSQNSRISGNNWEIILYNLVQPFTEISSQRTRFKVPGTDMILSQTFGMGLIKFTYWVALQGALNATWQKEGEFYRVNARFQEGTFLSSDME